MDDENHMSANHGKVSESLARSEQLTLSLVRLLRMPSLGSTPTVAAPPKPTEIFAKNSLGGGSVARSEVARSRGQGGLGRSVAVSVCLSVRIL